VGMDEEGWKESVLRRMGEAGNDGFEARNGRICRRPEVGGSVRASEWRGRSGRTRGWEKGRVGG